MSDMNRSFAGSMPEFYDRILVPVMFEPFALDLVERLHEVNSGHVLEIAAGTGVVTRALARKLPAAVAITATDLNPAMLDRAKFHAGMERVQWQEADAVALPFGDRLSITWSANSVSCSSPISRQVSARRGACCG